jgi:methyltransferase
VNGLFPFVSSLFVVILIVFGPMLIEAAVARRHEARQRAAGGVEAIGDVYRIMQVAYPGSFLAMILEGWVTGPAPARVAAVGGAVFLFAKILKVWVIRSLGRFWTFRVIVVPGAALVGSGPYRYVRHPNYVAVVGELIGVALMTGAVMTGPVVTVIFGALMLKRIGVEDRALADARVNPDARRPSR